MEKKIMLGTCIAQSPFLPKEAAASPCKLPYAAGMCFVLWGLE